MNHFSKPIYNKLKLQHNLFFNNHMTNFVENIHNEPAKQLMEFTKKLRH